MNEDFSLAQRIKIYLVSILLAPLGLYWFFKYFKDENMNKRKVAYLALYITIIVLFLSTILAYYYVKGISKYAEYYRSNLDVYTQLGY